MPPLESAARPPPAALNPHRVSQGPPWAGALALPVPRLCGLGGALGSGRWSGAWPLPRLLLSCPASSLCIDPFHRFWQDGQAQWCSGLGGCGLFSQVKASLGPDRLPPSAHGPKGQKWDVFTLRSGNCLITTVETAPGTLSCHPGLATVWMRGAVGSRHQPHFLDAETSAGAVCIQDLVGQGWGLGTGHSCPCWGRGQAEGSWVLGELSGKQEGGARLGWGDPQGAPLCSTHAGLTGLV